MSFYHFDGTKNVRQLTDGTESVTDEYQHDAWGEPMSSTGSTSNSQRYKGQLMAYHEDPDAAPEAQLALHHRHYDPQTGTFSSRDPAEDDPNLYRYVKNNPVNREDPSGLQERLARNNTTRPSEPSRSYVNFADPQTMHAPPMLEGETLLDYTVRMGAVEDPDLAERREQLATFRRTVKLVSDSYRGVLVPKSELLKNGGRRVYWKERPGFSPIIQDLQSGPIALKILWVHEPRPSGIGETVAGVWGVFPGELSDSEIASFYERHIDEAENYAVIQVAIDTALLAGGELFSALRAARSTRGAIQNAETAAAEVAQTTTESPIAQSGTRLGSIKDNPANRLIETGTPLKGGGWRRRWIRMKEADELAQREAIGNRYSELLDEASEMGLWGQARRDFIFDQMQKFRKEWLEAFLENRKY